MKNFPVKKSALILGISIIAVSVIAFLGSVVSVINTLVEYVDTAWKLQAFNSVFSCLTLLARGVGLGGIVVLLGLIYESVKMCSLMPQEKREEESSEAEQV